MTLGINDNYYYYFHCIQLVNDVYTVIFLLFFLQSAGKVKKSMVGWIAFTYCMCYTVHLIITISSSIAGDVTKVPAFRNL